jgi:hypothetical protein
MILAIQLRWQIGIVSENRRTKAGGKLPNAKMDAQDYLWLVRGRTALNSEKRPDSVSLARRLKGNRHQAGLRRGQTGN